MSVRRWLLSDLSWCAASMVRAGRAEGEVILVVLVMEVMEVLVEEVSMVVWREGCDVGVGDGGRGRAAESCEARGARESVGLFYASASSTPSCLQRRLIWACRFAYSSKPPMGRWVEAGGAIGLEIVSVGCVLCSFFLRPPLVIGENFDSRRS